MGCLVGLSADNGSPHADVFDSHRVDGERALFKHGEVSCFAALDAAELVVSMELVRSAGGDRVQRRLGRDALVLAEHPARRCDAVGRAG